MSRVTSAASHLTIEQVKQKLNEQRQPWRLKQWLIVYTALVVPRPAQEIALELGVSKGQVHKIIGRYNRFGPAVFETPGKGGRRRESLSLEEEQLFLAPFFAEAEQGNIATIEHIKVAFEARVTHSVHLVTIYRLLDRHGWRKLVPRGRHPKASQEAQEQFKKNFKA